MVGQGAGVEPLTKTSSDFDLFYICLTELLDVADDMEKFSKTENKLIYRHLNSCYLKDRQARRNRIHSSGLRPN